MWELLSKRKTLTIDAEDAKTELFRFEREMDVEAKDIQLVQQEKERAGHPYRSTLIAAQAVDGRLMTSSLTSEDVMARLVRTMRREHLTAQQLAEVMDENGDGTLSVQELHKALLEHLGGFLSEHELEALVKYFHGESDRLDSSVAIHELFEAVEYENFRGHVAVGCYLTGTSGTGFRVTNLQAESGGMAGIEVRSKEGKTGFYKWAEAFATFSRSMVGMRLQHPKRGKGVIVEVIPDDVRGKPYKIEFSNGVTTIQPYYLYGNQSYYL